jgi:hypothetical protein
VVDGFEFQATLNRTVGVFGRHSQRLRSFPTKAKVPSAIIVP